MATVTGTLTDFGLASLAPYSPQVVFTPSGAATSPTGLLATRPIEVTPATDGTFAASLAPTVDLHPATWYSIAIRWLDPDAIGPNQGFLGVDFPEWKLYVPVEGGDLSTLLAIPANPAQVWVGTGEPSNPTPGLWWLNPTTGDLSEWSN